MTAETTTPVDEEQAYRSRLWKAVLAKVDEIEGQYKGGRRSTKRGIAWYSADGRSCASRLEVGLLDGTTAVYWIEAYARARWQTRPGQVEVGVERSEHSDEPYWEAQLAKDAAEPDRVVIVGGVHYRLGKNGDRRSEHNGFAGARWEIWFFDGRDVVTYDLWHQGTVPAKFRDQFPDNARFATAE